MAINDNDVSNCVYPYTPTVYSYSQPTTYTFPFYSSYVDGIKSEAMKLALEAKSGRPFKEIAKLASQIEEWLRG